jgi:hypothetical protein
MSHGRSFRSLQSAVRLFVDRGRWGSGISSVDAISTTFSSSIPEGKEGRGWIGSRNENSHITSAFSSERFVQMFTTTTKTTTSNPFDFTFLTSSQSP